MPTKKVIVDKKLAKVVLSVVTKPDRKNASQGLLVANEDSVTAISLTKPEAKRLAKALLKGLED